MNKYQHHGFTLLELMATVSIIAILAALAVPSFTSTLERRRIVGAAERLQSDLRWARTEAIKRNKAVKVTFTSGADWKYVIDVDPDKDPDPNDKTITAGDYPGTKLASAAFAENTSTLFDQVRGTTTNGTAVFKLNDLQLEVDLSLMGRTRICGNTGGYESCSSN